MKKFEEQKFTIPKLKGISEESGESVKNEIYSRH